MNKELPLIDSAEDITPEKCPDLYNELCGGCEDEEEGEDCNE